MCLARLSSSACMDARSFETVSIWYATVYRYFIMSSTPIAAFLRLISFPYLSTTVTSCCPFSIPSWYIISSRSFSFAFFNSFNLRFSYFSYSNRSFNSISTTSVIWPLSAVPNELYKSRTNFIELINLLLRAFFYSFNWSSSISLSLISWINSVLS